MAKFSAPLGQFRVIGVDTFDGEDWLEGDFPTLIRAQEYVNEHVKGKQMLKMHIYDDRGNHVGEGGTY